MLKTLTTHLSTLLDFKPVQALRVLVLFCMVVWLIIPPVIGIIAYAQPPRSVVSEITNHQYLQEIANEHRFSVLETTVKAIDERTQFMQNSFWGIAFGMSALLGERGVSILRERKKRITGEESND